MITQVEENNVKMATGEDMKNRTAIGQQKVAVRFSKTHQDYWKTRLKRRTYVDRDGTRIEVPEWQVRIFYLGKEAWFHLQSSTQTTAAAKARDIYVFLLTNGWDAALAKYKPRGEEKDRVATVGEFLDDVGARGHLQPRTLRVYSTKLRTIVADLAKVESGLKGKALRAKHDYVHGGYKVWRTLVDGQPLDILTRESVSAWRNEYVANAGDDPLRRKSAERSAASVLRCVRALFADDIVQVLKVNVPSNPVSGVKLRDPGPQRYNSEINPEWLLAAAERELWSKKPQAFLALSLCLWAGLRRREADLLLWEQVDLHEGVLRVRRTSYFEPKTEESQRDVDLSNAAIDILRSFKRGAESEFVLNGVAPNVGANYVAYRASCTWKHLTAWLRSKGVNQRMAVHTLRKESGSLIACDFGIEAARQHLGHRDIRTTSSHYVAKKRRVEVSIGGNRIGEGLRVVE